MHFLACCIKHGHAQKVASLGKRWNRKVEIHVWRKIPDLGLRDRLGGSILRCKRDNDRPLREFPDAEGQRQ